MKRIRQSPAVRWEPGTASEFMSHLPDLLARGEGGRVVLMCRVSSDRQVYDGNLAEAVDKAEADLSALGVRAMRIFSGCERSGLWYPRPILDEALRFALDHDAILVAPSRDRFLRHQNLSSMEAPLRREYFDLECRAIGVPLATLQHPDAPPGPVRGEQTSRGQAAKGNYGGGDRKPGYKRRRREKLLPVVLALAGRSSLRDISREYGIPLKTVHRWINDFG